MRQIRFHLINLLSVVLVFLGGYYMTQTPYTEEGLWSCILALTILIGSIHEEVYYA